MRVRLLAVEIVAIENNTRGSDDGTMSDTPTVWWHAFRFIVNELFFSLVQILYMVTFVIII